jgi:hypothetical protein
VLGGNTLPHLHIGSYNTSKISYMNSPPPLLSMFLLITFMFFFYKIGKQEVKMVGDSEEVGKG